ncbi:MAG: HNH endonuclease domain-containing protein [Candidatus Heimdallarchaeaceae archaeon]
MFTKKETIDLDPFIPWSKFPVDRFWNLFPTCKDCNNKKSDKIIELEEEITERIINYLRITVVEQ